MEETKMMIELANLRTENDFLKKLLSESKLAMKNALNNEDADNRNKILEKAIEVLKANNIKDLHILQFDI